MAVTKTPPPKNIASIPSEALRRITFVGIDFDGVMNDGYVYTNQEGVETNRFSHRDGYGIDLLRKAGLHVQVISGQVNPIVQTRCAKLKIPCKATALLKTGEGKLGALKESLEELKIRKEACLFIGDDVNDIPALAYAGVGITVPNAHSKVMQECSYVTTARGGEGAIREIVDALLTAKGLQ